MKQRLFQRKTNKFQWATEFYDKELKEENEETTISIENSLQAVLKQLPRIKENNMKQRRIPRIIYPNWSWIYNNYQVITEGKNKATTISTANKSVRKINEFIRIYRIKGNKSKAKE